MFLSVEKMLLIPPKGDFGKHQGSADHQQLIALTKHQTEFITATVTANDQW